MLRKPIALLFSAALVVGLAACGDDGGGGFTAPGETSGSAATDAPATTAAGSDSADDTSGGSADSTEVPNFSGSGGDAFCSQAQGFEDTFGGEDFAASTDPNELRDDYAKAQDALSQLEDSAPDEIKGDVQIVSDAMSQLIEVFESADYDFTKLANDPEALAKLESFGSQEVQDASTRVEAYLNDVCGLDTSG